MCLTGASVLVLCCTRLVALSLVGGVCVADWTSVNFHILHEFMRACKFVYC
jgi:hypothetical protein